MKHKNIQLGNSRTPLYGHPLNMDIHYCGQRTLVSYSIKTDSHRKSTSLMRTFHYQLCSVINLSFFKVKNLQLTACYIPSATQARIDTGFHGFTEIGQIFHNKYLFYNKKLSKLKFCTLSDTTWKLTLMKESADLQDFIQG